MACPLETKPLPGPASLDAFILGGMMMDQGLDPLIGFGMAKGKWFFGSGDLLALGMVRGKVLADIVGKRADAG